MSFGPEGWTGPTAAWIQYNPLICTMEYNTDHLSDTFIYHRHIHISQTHSYTTDTFIYHRHIHVSQTHSYITRPYGTSWWHHQMETFSPLLALCAGNSLVTSEFPSQRPVTRSFDVFFHLRVKGWVNNRDAGDLRHHSTHYDVIVM